MPSLRIIPDGDGALAALMPPWVKTTADVEKLIKRGKLIHLADDAEIIVSGLEGGMQSGAPSMVFGFKLPDGKIVMAETSWRLFALAYRQFAEKFGEKPDLTGMEVLADIGGGGPSKFEIRSDDAPTFVECELCGERQDLPPGSSPEEQAEMLLWLKNHFEQKHPGWSAP